MHRYLIAHRRRLVPAAAAATTTTRSSAASTAMSSTTASNGESLHIVMFPWLAFGHLMPFIKLSKCLAKKGHKITFLSTPRNIDRLPQIPSDLAHLFTFVKLPPLPNHPDLPDNAEATTDVPPEKVQYLKKVFDDGMQEPLSKLLQGLSPKPDWLIHDFVQYWAPSVASKLDIPTAYFSVFPATALGFTGPPSEMMGEERSRHTPEQFTVPPSWIPFPSEVAFRLHEAQWFAGAYNPNASGVSDMYRFGAAIEGVDAVLIRTCTEYEGEWMTLLQDLYQKPVIPTGLLPPSEQEMANGGGAGAEKLFEWLDKQKPGSVVYAALGSEATLSIELVHELALGLEKSQMPFLWALRRPIGLAEDVQLLPEGFEDSVKDRGMVTMGWAPQLQILAHGSVGGFLTHAGWSSTVEGMQTGRPQILLPIFVDQGLNTRVMVEKKVGVELTRDEKEGSFTRDGVAGAVRKVMVEQVESFTANAAEMKKVFADVELHYRYIDDFVKYLKDHRRIKTNNE